MYHELRKRGTGVRALEHCPTKAGPLSSRGLRRFAGDAATRDEKPGHVPLSAGPGHAPAKRNTCSRRRRSMAALSNSPISRASRPAIAVLALALTALAVPFEPAA